MEFPPWTTTVSCWASHGRAVPLLTMTEAQDYCNQKPKCVPIKKIWMIAINSTFLWINIMCLCQKALACSQKLTVTHKSIFPVAQQTISLCWPVFTGEKGFFLSLRQHLPRSLLPIFMSTCGLQSALQATDVEVVLWLLWVFTSHWYETNLFPRAAPPFPRSDVIQMESMTRICPLSCSPIQQNRCAVSIPDTTATLNNPSCSPCGTARKELCSGHSDLG